MTTDILDFDALKRSSKNSLETYAEEMKKLKTSSYQEDTRFWNLTADKAGNGRAIIRFLPPIKGEPAPFVKYFAHGFQVGTSWYIENCPTSLSGGARCPVCEENNVLWGESTDDKHPSKAIVRKRKRVLNYVSNILVVKDDAEPSNNGKVFLFRYGKQIFEKIEEALNPKYEDEEKLNPFDFWAGANFILKQKMVDSYKNFTDSKFDRVSAISGNDEEIKKIWESQYPLRPFIDPSNYKPFDELKRNFDRVVSSLTPKKSAPLAKVQEETPPWDDLPKSSKAKTTEEFFAELDDDKDEEEEEIPF